MKKVRGTFVCTSNLCIHKFLPRSYDVDPEVRVENKFPCLTCRAFTARHVYLHIQTLPELCKKESKISPFHFFKISESLLPPPIPLTSTRPDDVEREIERYDYNADIENQNLSPIPVVQPPYMGMGLEGLSSPSYLNMMSPLSGDPARHAHRHAPSPHPKTCQICFEPLTLSDLLRVNITCENVHHVFHQTCLNIKKIRKCPICYIGSNAQTG